MYRSRAVFYMTYGWIRSALIGFLLFGESFNNAGAWFHYCLPLIAIEFLFAYRRDNLCHAMWVQLRVNPLRLPQSLI